MRQSVFPFLAMDNSGRPAKDAPNPQEFGGEWQKLLEAFDSDPATALQNYQVARNGLVCVFRARGLESDAEDLADEVFDRVLRHLTEKASTDPIRDLSRFIQGTAKNVACETYRNQRTVPFNDERETASPALWDAPEDKAQWEEWLARLDTALDQLPESQRSLIIRYYKHSKTEKIRDRAAIARELGMTTDALRVKVCKIRTKIAKLLMVDDSDSAIRANDKRRRPGQ